MKNKIKNTTLFAITIGVVINLISSVIYSKIENVDFITGFVELWKKLFNFFIMIINFRIPVWVIIIVLFIFFVIIKIYIAIIDSKEKYQPKYMNYLSDTYKGIIYQWELNKYGNGIKLENIIPVCNCGGQFTMKQKHKNIHYGSPKLYCVNCDKIIEENFDEEVLQDAELYFTNKVRQLMKKEQESNKE